MSTPTEQPSEGAPAATRGAWRRLSPWALVVIFVGGLANFVRQNLYVFLGAGAGFATLDWLGPREMLLLALAVLLFGLVSAIIFYRRFRFRLEDDAIRVRQGLFEKKELRVRFARVMNVNISQPLYMRPLNLVRFSLQTPGASTKEVELPGITRELAEEMCETIAMHRRETAVEDGDIPETPAIAASAGGEVLHHAGTGDLMLHGLVSSQIWILAGALGSVFGMLESRFRGGITDWLIGAPSRFVSGTVLVIGVLVVMLAVVVVITSMVIAWVRFHDYTLTMDGDRYRSRAGLLNTREQTVPAIKLHGFVAVQTALGTLVGRWYLLGRQTGAMDWEAQARHGHFTVPGLDRERIEKLLARLQPGVHGVPRFLPVLTLFRRVMGLRLVLVFGALAAGLGLWLHWQHPLVMASLGVLVPLLCLMYLRWRRWGYCLEGPRLWVKHGLIGQRITVFDLERVQQVEVRQSPAQFRRGAANLVLVLPHGPVTIPFLSLADARALADLALWRMETARAHRL